ncbi:hypothetical protein IEO21_06326 [Rhodonia placenta]|uniref:FMN hydroxy acid dehydrogenase domain-containing protein n=1 Tax=Rhodonia placenta TaxID=104341 RepID=A0A8H7U194_9APHY|nr:hypothetical protein IEO21_06326 [Postia placenta]
MSSAWSTFAKTSYTSRRAPVLGTFGVDKLEQIAREKLKESPDAFLYVFGSAGTGSTKEENRKEFERWKIVPRVLRNVAGRNSETTLFGVKYPSPLLFAPVGAQGIVHADAEEASSAAAGKLGVPFIMSSASTRSIEAVAKANGSGPRWFQLYWGKTNDVMHSLITRAKTNGFSAIVFTVDSMMIGWRPFDLDTGYLPFGHGVGAQVGLTDPVFMRKVGLDVFPPDAKPEFPYVAARQDELIAQGDKAATDSQKAGQAFVGEMLDPAKVWEDLAYLRKHWEGPLIIKGVLCAEDAELAIKHGADGIVVSTHGGRQIDGSISSLFGLHQIMQSPIVRTAQAEGRFTILLDSGVRTGSDIFKALALGAQGVLYGRPVMYALAIAGQEGVEAQVRTVLADFEITLGLAGYASVDELRKNGEKALVRI